MTGLAEYRAAAKALDGAVEALIGENVAGWLVGADVIPYPLRARLHIDADRFDAIQHRLGNPTAYHREGSGWHRGGDLGPVRVVALSSDRPDWLPAEAVTP